MDSLVSLLVFFGLITIPHPLTNCGESLACVARSCFMECFHWLKSCNCDDGPFQTFYHERGGEPNINTPPMEARVEW